MTVFLEILKMTIPALVVFMTVYFLMKQYLNKEYQIKVLEYRQKHSSTTTPLKLQAYERLSLFCERISIPNLLLRLRSDKQNAGLLRLSMLIAIQQEFEHNITQQVYVSDNLWKIIKIARDDTVNIINGVAEKLEPKAPGEEYANFLLNYLDSQDFTSLDKALQAIKKEAGVLLG